MQRSVAAYREVFAHYAGWDWARVRREAARFEDGVALHTNHFLSPGFDGADVSVWVMPDSPLRLQRIQAGLSRPGGPPTLADFRALLADHAYPSGLCCHPDPRMDPYDQGATVASVLMDLGSQQMHLADGNPCTTPYRRLGYREFLAKPSTVAEPAGAGETMARIPSR